MKTSKIFTLIMSFWAGFSIVLTTQINRICECNANYEPLKDVSSNLLPALVFLFIYTVYRLFTNSSKRIRALLLIALYSIVIIAPFFTTEAYLLQTLLILALFFTSIFILTSKSKSAQSARNYIDGVLGEDSCNIFLVSLAGFALAFMIFVDYKNGTLVRVISNNTNLYKCKYQSCDEVKGKTKNNFEN